MKNMRRIFSMLLVMVMIVTFALPGMTAKAAGTDIYDVYQIFTGTLTGDSMKDIAWGENGTGGDLAAALEELKKVKNGSDQQKLDVILKYADLDSNPCEDDVEVPAGTTVTIENLKPGYYLIKNANGSQENGESYGLYVARVTNGTIQFTPKVSAPTVDKTVDKGNVNIGDKVSFAVTATMSERLSDFETYKLKFTDTMSDGLTFDKTSVKVMLGANDLTEYFVVSSIVNKDGTTSISIACVDILKITNPKIKAGDEIVVTYNATLNSKAEIGVEGEDNKVKLEYSNNPNISEDDLDGDGIPNDKDPDIDGDGKDNDVDDDDDNDGVKDDKDLDDDNDGIPDVIDPGYNPDGDDDGDGTSNDKDKDHPAYDTDGDGIPDIIDPDDDNDGILDENDDDDKNDKWPDKDGDGIPDVIDPNPDKKPEPTTPKAEDDFDGDGIPDSEDPDIDGDGIINEEDPDDDNDGIPDVTDPDDDNDGDPDDKDPDDKFDDTGVSETPEVKVEVTTGGIKVIKTDEAGKKLSGVEFVLLNAQKDKIALVENGKLVKWVDYSGSTTDYVLTTVNGEIQVEGLANGTYYLKEIKTLANYNLLTEMVQVSVNEAKTTEVNVINYPGTALPETGGIGTTIFYVLGGLMVAGAAVLLVTKKRMGNE